MKMVHMTRMTIPMGESNFSWFLFAVLSLYQIQDISPEISNGFMIYIPLDHPSIEAASLIFFSNSAVKSSLRTRIPGWLLDSFERVLRTLRILRIFRTLRIFRIPRILRNKKNCGPSLVYVILANELVGAAWPRGRALFSQRGSWGSHVHRTTGCWVFCVCCIYMYMYYIYTYICVYIHIYICNNIYIHIHLHIHICIWYITVCLILLYPLFISCVSVHIFSWMTPAAIQTGPND